MSVRQYIGARYVPIFADPIQWDNDTAYEPLTVVMNDGTSYVSRKSVPAGIAISNTDYWIAWADYNAQIEAYRAEVAQYNERISTLEGKFDANGDIKAGAIADDFITNAMMADNAIDTIQVKDSAITSAKIADGTIATGDIADSAITSAKIADGAIATGDIADGAVTSAKIADGAIATGDIADGAVTSAKIADGTIATGDIADGAITPEKIAKKRVVFVGDSYGQGYTPDGSVTSWVDYASSVLNASGWNVSKISVGGIAFGDNTFLLTLQTLVGNMSASQKNEVELVYCGGGFNDRDMSNSAIHSGIIAFDNYIKATFPNIKRAIIDCFGMGVEGRTSGTFASYTFAKMCSTYESYITACNDNNTLCKIAADGIGVLRRNSYFSSDYVHPNSAGQHAIANHVINIINGSGSGINTYASDDYLGISDGDHSISIIGVQTGEHEILFWSNSTITLNLREAYRNFSLTSDAHDTGYVFTPTAGFQIRRNFGVPILLSWQNTDSKYYTVPAKLLFTVARKVMIMAESINDSHNNFNSCNASTVKIRMINETYSIPFKPCSA